MTCTSLERYSYVSNGLPTLAVTIASEELLGPGWSCGRHMPPAPLIIHALVLLTWQRGACWFLDAAWDDEDQELTPRLCVAGLLFGLFQRFGRLWLGLGPAASAALFVLTSQAGAVA